ncbi:alpha/beta hydrolase family protein [Sphingobium sp. CAP-1]|uniref:alpha/beta hydrolase family protein n=1 Tax=Sphingobium sp. CAP-1 TaxID=2676077 RepID=UPI0012BB43B0|nr:alpha/beta fold hydrolase [Sphingobium sp. CAP-1]QGP78264.1 alpha/beta fold hydrolase [Sphingobium sp. CAP-1]
MIRSSKAMLTLLAASAAQGALAQQPDELARAFGARETVISASLSTDGQKIALIAAGPGRTTRAYVVEAMEGAEPKLVASTSGKPEYLQNCGWVAADRLACQIFGTQRYADDVYSFSNIVAVDAGGGNVKLLSQRRGANALGYDFRGGDVVDLLPDEEGAILMTRSYVPEAKIGSLIEKKLEGLGVDRIDTRSGGTKRIETPQSNAIDYISDGHGTVRVVGLREVKGSGYDKGTYKFLYRPLGKSGWSDLSTYDQRDNDGFVPVAVDGQKNIVYGLEKTDGRDALVTIALDPGLEKKVVFAHPQVDVGGLIRVGRDRRVVGVSYAVEHREAVYFDEQAAALVKSLGKALGGKAVHIGDMSADGQRVLVWAGSDVDPGQYYLFDRAARKLSPVMPDRPELAGRPLATMQSVSYKAGDGTMIPAYLTLPPGKESARGLPAIVMPHGGPESRDEWGFDWMVQYYAARGFAVIQPQFRGAAGFGEKWLMKNGYRSWRTAIGDVVDAGRWLVAQGVADPAKLTIAGWSYGGYAALQAQAVDPNLFKAVVAIAPVTDFADRMRRSQYYSNYLTQQQRMGTGQEAEEASPSNHAAEFRAPVLMFHGTDDNNVDITQAKIMQGKLEGAGKRSQLIVYDGLEHSLDDSDARADLLQKSADFLLAAGK